MVIAIININLPWLRSKPSTVQFRSVIDTQFVKQPMQAVAVREHIYLSFDKILLYRQPALGESFASWTKG